MSLARLNEPAPEFEAITTQGPLKLSDLRGKWVVLFSHPADFTPVCSTEFGSFAAHAGEFEARGVQLVGLSVDSVQAHLAWIRDIEQVFGHKVTFPVIADLDMKVSTAYGMIHPGANSTQAVRSVFFIDDKGVLRAMIYYPMNVGRNIKEILRVVDALQTADRNGVSTPADWTPGERVVVPAPANASAFETPEEAAAKGLEYKTWYLRTKQI
ncbi:MAG: peroxiredoxin [Alicyclobacillus mali]|uniref:peroxiredoxin n=1 Tax=Alicyclobacillus mali (ex Roth et al. 2021) TaxID=1123961 RepID=UPI0023F38B3B|nr:peroxiredoxin [Alicyclobacillus mali (ex Roth et al. 2021)]MCL6487374.1 peroxiredoxin [Alicyclobacillus mali (ex Roth et al. 2021)]